MNGLTDTDAALERLQSMEEKVRSLREKLRIIKEHIPEDFISHNGGPHQHHPTESGSDPA